MSELARRQAAELERVADAELDKMLTGTKVAFKEMEGRSAVVSAAMLTSISLRLADLADAIRGKS